MNLIEHIYQTTFKCINIFKSLSNYISLRKIGQITIFLLFSYQLIDLTINYCNFETNIDLKLNSSFLKLPALTICAKSNNNIVLNDVLNYIFKSIKCLEMFEVKLDIFEGKNYCKYLYVHYISVNYFNKTCVTITFNITRNLFSHLERNSFTRK